MQVAKFYGWTLEDIRRLTVEEWDSAVDAMNRMRKQEAGGGRAGQSRNRSR